MAKFLIAKVLQGVQLFMSKQFSVLLSTAFLPPIQWFVYLLKAEKVLIENFETYPKQTYRNRCEISTANGKQVLTIPVIKIFGNHTKTHEIEIANDEKWQIRHWRSLVAAYANSPYFLYYQDELQPFFLEEYINLMEFNLCIIKSLMAIIGIYKSIELTDTFELNPKNVFDLRNEITPKRTFDHFHLPTYYQVFEEKNGFFSGLSIIDLLFNMGPETFDVLNSVNVNC
ncbi:MAG: WbqC-like protein family protein [Bacteroidetes bacterium ADurb.Bin041]|nr:MAG: WbqC-like protein family protein [Bacteroidetes bacterium ADurb.Bin041]